MLAPRPQRRRAVLGHAGQAYFCGSDPRASGVATRRAPRSHYRRGGAHPCGRPERWRNCWLAAILTTLATGLGAVPVFLLGLRAGPATGADGAGGRRDGGGGHRRAAGAGHGRRIRRRGRGPGCARGSASCAGQPAAAFDHEKRGARLAACQARRRARVRRPFRSQPSGGVRDRHGLRLGDGGPRAGHRDRDSDPEHPGGRPASRSRWRRRDIPPWRQFGAAVGDQRAAAGGGRDRLRPGRGDHPDCSPSPSPSPPAPCSRWSAIEMLRRDPWLGLAQTLIGTGARRRGVMLALSQDAGHLKTLGCERNRDREVDRDREQVLRSRSRGARTRMPGREPRRNRAGRQDHRHRGGDGAAAKNESETAARHHITPARAANGKKITATTTPCSRPVSSSRCSSFAPRPRSTTP